MAGDHAAPAQHPHIAKGVASPNRNGLRRADSQLHAPVRQRIPDAVKYLLKDQQFHIIKMTIKINNHLPGALRLNNIVDRNRQLTPPAVGDLLALLSGDLHFFDNRAPFL